jgi:hypothetical protein
VIKRTKYTDMETRVIAASAKIREVCKIIFPSNRIIAGGGYCSDRGFSYTRQAGTEKSDTNMDKKRSPRI